MNRPLGRRGLLLGAPALLGGTALLGGCGFQPVYMRTASGKPGPGQRDLAKVFVRIIPERPGQLLRQALQQRFGSDAGGPMDYDLAVHYAVSGESVGIEQSSIATRVRLSGIAAWRLLPHDGPARVVTAGGARVTDGVDVYDSQYFAADLGVEAAEQRMANEIAQQITTQLAVWFRQQAAKRAG